KRADFRKQYAEYLADPISGMPKMQTLAQQLGQAKLSYDQSLLTRDSLIAQLKQVPQFRPSTATGGGGPGSPAASPLVTRLQTAQSNLATLRLKFTDQHPDVIAMQNEVADLQAQVQNAAAATAAAVAAAKAATASGAPTTTPEVQSDITN